jgi:dGTPase
MNIRERIEQREKDTLKSQASLSILTKGRKIKEEKDSLRTEYMRDRDRIIHSESFRRLKHKTQVFLAPRSEEFRTRLTHTLEVSQIARTISRALDLNEDLTEAIALGHDVGHTPFGHAGEDVIREIAYPDFKHSHQSVRVLESIEKKGKGLNLTLEVLDGIEKHSKTGNIEILPENSDEFSCTIEGEIVRISDIIAYVNHDIDDAISSGILNENDLPKELIELLGSSHADRINVMVNDVIEQSADRKHIVMSDDIHNGTKNLRNFLFNRVYKHPIIENEMKKAKKILYELFELFTKDMDIIYNEIPFFKEREEDKKRNVVDYLALMTDYEAIRLFYRFYIPKSFFISEQE